MPRYRVDWIITQKIDNTLKKYKGFEYTSAVDEEDAKTKIYNELQDRKGKYDTNLFPVIKIVNVIQVEPK